MPVSGRGPMAEVAAIGTTQIEVGGAIFVADGHGNAISA